MEYPAWVPPQIQMLDWEFFGDRSELQVSDETIRSHEMHEFARLANIFASNPEIEKVGKSLDRANPEARPGDNLWNLFREIHGILIGGTSYADKESKSSRNKKLSQLQAASRKLARLVKETRIESFMPYLGFEHYIYNEDRRKLEPYSTRVRLQEILDRLEAEAERAKDIEGILNKSQRNDQEREIAYFAYYLHEYFLENYDSYLDETIAVLINVLFDKNVDREFVRGKRATPKKEINQEDIRWKLWDS